MGRFLGITGTPGTGKKTLAPLVAEILDLPYVGLNELVPKSREKLGIVAVDTIVLRRRLLAFVKGRCLVYGHLLPDSLQRTDVERVVVLRCEPAKLKRRLRLRPYGASKVTANVEAELIGVVASLCFQRFGEAKVVEYDTTSGRVAKSAEMVAGLFTSQHARAPRVDWLARYGSASKLRSLLSVARTESAFT